MALDLAKQTGVAYGYAGDRRPKAMTWRLGNPINDGDFGSRFTKLRLSLFEFIALTPPDCIAFEAPLLGGGHGGAERARLLIGMAAIVEQVAHERGIECVEKAASTARKHFCGKGTAKKPEVQARCRQLGWPFASADEADALALWDLVSAEIYPAAAIRSAPLFSMGAR
jgi:Holliday junction resolvasome RuvABC endonuclease subunit